MTRNKKRPPKSIRFCANCLTERVFKYNPTIGHSSCILCGWRLIPTTMSQDEYDSLELLYQTGAFTPRTPTTDTEKLDEIQKTYLEYYNEEITTTTALKKIQDTLNKPREGKGHE